MESGLFSVAGNADIFLDDLVVDVGSIDLLYAGLDQGIVPDLHGKGERFAFPVPIDIIIQVLGVLVADQRIEAAPGVEVIGRVLWRIFIVPQEGKVGVVDDLYHPEIVGVRDGILPGDRHAGYELPCAVQAEGRVIDFGMEAGGKGQTGGDEAKR